MKKRIFLTGATGLMGWATLQELLKKSDKFDITVLVRNSKTNREKMTPLAGNVNIVWGDLTRYDDVLKAIQRLKLIVFDSPVGVQDNHTQVVHLFIVGE